MKQTRLQDTTSASRSSITVRVSTNVADILAPAASMVGETLNQFVIQAALEKAEKILENKRIPQISESTAVRFFDLLDKPPAPSQNLVDTLNRHYARKTSNKGSNSSFEFNLQPKIEAISARSAELMSGYHSQPAKNIHTHWFKSRVGR